MNNKPIFCILGKTGAGKSTLFNVLVGENLFGYNFKLKRLIYSTTRPPREGEKNGVDYNFKSEEQLCKDRFNSIVELRKYTTLDNGTKYYYTTFDELNMDGDFDAYVCAASVDQAIGYIDAGYSVYFIIVDPDVQTRMLRVLNRNANTDDRCFELCRRILEEQNEFDTVRKVANDKNSVTITTNLEGDILDLDGAKYSTSEIFLIYNFIYDKIAENNEAFT